MAINVKKLDGSTEALNLDKILRWGNWASKGSPDISFESVLSFTSTAFYDGITTSEITEAICKACEDLAKASSDEEDYNLTEQYNNLARNLYIPNLIKKANYTQSSFLTEEDVYTNEYCIDEGDCIPLPRYKIKSVIRFGIHLNTYDPELLDGSLSDELFEYADSLIDYHRMQLHPYGGLRQVEEKYLRRSDGTLIEDPQQLYILMALAATHADAKVYPNGSDLEFQKEAVENYYRVLSTGEMNAPTPFLLSLRTDFKQYDSCCFTLGTLVDTPAGVVPIETIEEGSQVYNECGHLVEVLNQTSREYQGLVYSFNTVTQPTDEWYCTKDHKIRVKSGDNSYVWKEAADITTEDYLYIPFIQQSLEPVETYQVLSDHLKNDYKLDKGIIKRTLPGAPSTAVTNIDLKNNKDFFRLLGYFAGDGHTASDRYVYLTLGRSKEYIDDILEIYSNVFGTTPKVVDQQEKDNTVAIKMHSEVIKDVISNILGNNCKDKADYLNFIQSASLECIEQFVIGYFRTDGCAYNLGYTLSSANKALINVLRQCLLKLKVTPSINKRNRVTDFSNGKELVLYTLNISLGKDHPLIIKIGRDSFKITKTLKYPQPLIYTPSGCFVPVKNIKTKYINERVYDITVACSSHSFTVDGIAVHNCLFSINDTNISIKAGMGVAMDATVAGAGVGVSLGRVRSKGTRFRKMGKHQGVLGYLGQLSKTVKGSSQECYSDDTEVLTERGFILFSELLDTDLVAQVNDDNSLTFVKPSKIFSYDYDGPMVHLRTKRNSGIDLLVTPNHNLVYKHRKDLPESGQIPAGFKKLTSSRIVSDTYKEEYAIDFQPTGNSVFYHSGYKIGHESLLTAYERLLIAFQADGIKNSMTNGFFYCFHLKRQDKIDRLLWLAKEAGQEVIELSPSSVGSRKFKVKFRSELNHHFSYSWLKDKSSEWCLEFLKELRHWGGSLSDANDDSFVYSSVHKADVDFAQAVASQAGAYTNVYVSKPDAPHQPCYVVSVSFSKPYTLGTSLVKKILDYSGKVYCVEVPTHKLVVRRNFKTAICGNSRGGGATVNFPLWTRDIYDLLLLKDVTGVEGENRYRHLDYAFHFSMYMVEKLRTNGKILLVSPNTLVSPGVTVYDAFYKVDGKGNYDPEAFNNYCEALLKDPDLPYITSTNSATVAAGKPAYTTAYDLFSALVQQMINTGRIYTFNVDNVNNHSAYLDLVEMSNLCLGQGTPILTKDGYQPIEELEDQTVEVWNGKQWSKTTFKKTSERSKLLKVSFSDGSEIYATEYHKWHVHTSSYEKKADKAILKRTHELSVGDSIQRHNDNYVTDSDLVLDKAYTNGFYSGDGHYDKTKNKACAWVYAPKLSVLPNLECDTISSHNETYSRTHVSFTGLQDKFFVPLGYSTESKVNWLAGLLDADGTVTTVNGQDQIQLTSIHKSFLLDVRLLLSELGINSKVRKVAEAGLARSHPDQKEYETKELFRITISGYFTTKLLHLGLKTSRLVFNSNSILSNRGHFVTVESVEDLETYGPTWCCTEPLENKFVANGILTGNCMEILQPTYPVSLSYNSKDNIYTPDPQSEVSFCQLAGIVVGRDVTLEDLPRICYWTLRLQEAIFNISDYSSITFSNRQKKRRNVGIGLVNLQHLLVREVYSKFPQKDWIYQVGKVTHEWYEAIQYNLILASTQIAEVLGPCEEIERSRYGHGILPIDHAKSTPLTDYELKQDWEGTLRPRLIKFKSRFSNFSALMPAESSSVVFGTINGPEFPRQPSTFKGNKKLTVLVTVPEVAKYGKDYVYAWGDYSVDVNDIYLASAANITKFLDQSISYNFYVDYNKFPDNKVTELWMLNTFIIKPAYAGIKTTYYANFNVDIKDKESKEDASEEMTEEEKQFYENLRQLEQDGGAGCASGACSL